LDNIGNSTLRVAGHPIYRGTTKVQASGLLLIGTLENSLTQSPLFISIEGHQLNSDIYNGNLMVVSSFDKSVTGKIYLSKRSKITDNLPPHKGIKLTIDEINLLPELIRSNLYLAGFKSHRENKVAPVMGSRQSRYLKHVIGSYNVQYSNQKNQTISGTLHISEDGSSSLDIEYRHYEGIGTICEGSILSIYFGVCDGIPHCSHIMSKVNKMRENTLSISAGWFHLDEHYNWKLSDLTLEKV